MHYIRKVPIQKICETAVISLLVFAIIWKGGKTLETTWLLLLVSSLCILIQNWILSSKKTKSRHGESKNNLHTEIIILLSIFITWTVLSYLFSKTQNYGLDEVLRTGGLGLILIWYINRTSEDDDQNIDSFENSFIKWFAGIAALVCLIGMIVYIFQPVNRFVGTFFDHRFHTDYWPNAYAQFLLLSWPIALYVSSLSENKNKKNKYFEKIKISIHPFLYSVYKLIRPFLKYVPTGLILGCLLLTYSRGAFIAFFGQIFLLSILILGHRGSRKRLNKPLTHIALGLVFGFVLFVGINELRSVVHPVQSISQKVTFTAPEGKSSVSERSSFWKHSLIMTADKPIFGWGPYSFRFVHPRYQEHVLATSDHPHNVFLKLSSERGIIAAMIFALLLFMALKPGIETSIKGKRFTVEDHARLGYPLVVTAISGVIAHNLIDYNLQFVGISLPFWILIAILIKRAKFNKPLFIKKNIKIRLSTITSAMALMLLFVATHEAVFLLTSSFGRHAEASGNTDKAIAWYEISENELFTRDMRLSQIHIHIKNKDFELAILALDNYMKRNNQDARAWKLKGEIHLLKNEFDSAINAFDQAFEYGGWNDLGISRGMLEALFAKTFTQPTTDAAADSKNLSLHPKIAEIAPKVETRVREFTRAIESNIHFVALSPNPEDAIKILITLSVLFPDNADEYHLLMEKIEKKAKEERGKIKSRNPGWLW
jgi:tetratricopeptide (TPR) repeat protein